ncbi:hypothetical protein NAT51_00675 [Flavobacterium amniphilum]|uniref:hypothetical protein n=1 Tax=Flavobacterium amniphilum TaxID=1834035 RepID=UPI00202AA726|nr:hypothetical protein [Flavobacterium amniphilum]MCL9804017.1 hypothetical protein [Flavobacterium amniphilum]
MLLPIFIGSFSVAFAQEKISTVAYEGESLKGINSIVDQEDNKTLLLLHDKSKTDVLVLDETFKQTGKITLAKEVNEKSQYLGYSKNQQNYYTYWENPKEGKIEVKHLNLSDNTSGSSEIPFVLEKEIIFNCVTVKNSFYILSILKNTNTLNVYKLQEGQLEKKSIDCSHLKFINHESKPVNFWKLYSEYDGRVYSDGIKSVNTSIHNSIVLSTQKKKSYINGDSIILAFDNNYNFNQNLIINLNDYSITQKVLQQENIIPKSDMTDLQSNSFMVNNKVFLIKTGDQQVFVTIKDLDNNVLKKISYTATDLGQYVNSEVVQEAGSIKSRRALEKPIQFVRKVGNLNPAITGVYENGKYTMTIGGVSYPQQSNGALIGGMVGGLAGALVGALVTSAMYSPTIDSYANKNIVSLKCIMDENFNPTSEKTEESNFERLRIFIEGTVPHAYPHIFISGKDLMYSGYDKENKVLNIYKF